MRYIGSKQMLAEAITRRISEVVGGVCTVGDVFAGAGSVGRALKRAGFRVIASDLLFFCYVLQRAYIQLSEYPDFQRLHLAGEIVGHGYDGRLRLLNMYELVLDFLNSLPGEEGLVYARYSPAGTAHGEYIRRYFTDENARKIDAIRARIETWKEAGLISDDEYYLLLGTLLEAIPTYANILGTFGAFKKGAWEDRAQRPLQLSPIYVAPSPHANQAFCSDANVLIRHIDCDVLYIDPPYNRRQYSRYYHVLEAIATQSSELVIGLTGLPLHDTKLSKYCSKVGAKEYLKDLIDNARCRHIFLSYSSEGSLSEDEIVEILSRRGRCTTPLRFTRHRRYKSDKDREADDSHLPRKYSDERTVEERLYHMEVTN